MKLKILIFSFDKNQVESFLTDISQFFLKSKCVIPVNKIWTKKKFNVLRSPFKHRDSQEQISIEFVRATIIFKLQTTTRILIFLIKLLSYLQLNYYKNLNIQFKIEY